MSDHYCFDENVSTHIVKLLIKLGVDGCHITEHLPAGTPDPEIIPLIASNGWILVSGDARMRTAHASVLAKHRIRVLDDQSSSRDCEDLSA